MLATLFATDLLALGASSARQCIQFALSEVFNRADVVFLGTATAVERNGVDGVHVVIATATCGVERIWTGPSQGESPHCSCLRSRPYAEGRGGFLITDTQPVTGLRPPCHVQSSRRFSISDLGSRGAKEGVVVDSTNDLMACASHDSFATGPIWGAEEKATG